MEAFPEFPPSRGSGMDTRAQVETKELGDGYTQSAGTLADNLTHTYRARFTARAVADIEAIEAFLTAQAGHGKFLFTVPGEEAPRVFRCRQWQREYINRALASLHARFEDTLDAPA